MLIEWADKVYEYDPSLIDVLTAVKVREHTALGMRSWERAIDDGDPIALQALLWVVLRQNGENVPLKTLNFSVLDFYNAVATAATNALNEKIEAAVSEVEAEDPTAPVE